MIDEVVPLLVITKVFRNIIVIITLYFPIGLATIKLSHAEARDCHSSTIDVSYRYIDRLLKVY